MTEPTRWVVIDDGDSRIEYSGTWTSTSGDDYNNQGNFGSVYRNTLRESKTNESSLTFTFIGNTAFILGTNNAKIETNPTAVDPDWECTLDGKTNIGAKSDPFPYVENNWFFCSFNDLVGGEHTIGLTVKTKGRSFWFDQIRYRPTDTVEHEVVAAGRDDADLTYSTGWSPLADVAHNTLVKGSNATFKFIGTGASLWSMFPTELSHDPAEGSYTIDSGSPITFAIPGGSTISSYNRKIFEVSGLTRKDHTLVITYQSDGGKTPLVVSNILIEGGTNLRASAQGTTSTTPSGTALPSNSSSPSGDGSTSKKAPVGAIIGGVIGAIAVLVLLLLLAWYPRRRRRTRPTHLDLNDDNSERDLELPHVSAYTEFSTTPQMSTTVSSPLLPPTARSKRQIMLHVSEGSDRPQQTEIAASGINSESISDLSSSDPIFHEDSGLRVYPPPRPEEFPPTYTPQ